MQPSNYIPVALLSCIGKLQERIVFKNMYNFLIDNKLLYNYQSGFLTHHSTAFQISDTFYNICQAFADNMFSFIMFCDVSKAFASARHKCFLKNNFRYFSCTPFCGGKWGKLPGEIKQYTKFPSFYCVCEYEYGWYSGCVSNVYC